MMAAASPSFADGPATTSEAFRELARTCEAARGADRALDAQIALAMFPDLAGLKSIAVAIWKHPDGSRIRALRYSFTSEAASTLVPAGHWVERDPDAPHRIWIYGPRSDDAASGQHAEQPLAIGAAALRSRARAAAIVIGQLREPRQMGGAP